jgi:predicted Zn-dependent protease with MMP-like domain
MGIVGLIMHLGILFYVMIKASFQVMFRIRDPILKYKISALIAGMAGIMLASYGNAVLGQMPGFCCLYQQAIINTDVFEKKLADQIKLNQV